MKYLTIILLFIFSPAISQTTNGVTTQKKPLYSEDSDIKVFYTDDIDSHNLNKNTAAIFINDSFCENQSIFNALNPNKIDSVNIEKGKFQQEGKTYYGKIHIKLKPDYTPKFLTIKQLSDKYLKLNNLPLLFKIDGKAIDQDFNNYWIDESFILKINVSKVQTSQKNINISIINIYTKTSENIKKANNIILKGNKL